MMLSEHFSLEQMTASEIALRRGLSNIPPVQIVDNLRTLCRSLERIREYLGAELVVHSGYRSYEVNTLLGGAANSAHMQGLACDFTAPNYGPPQKIARSIIESDIAFDQLIFEFGSWVHFAISDNMRKQVLSANSKAGSTVYTAGIA
jgi:zinc D-Ala-D-Ala carboxypeptidase